MYNQSKSILASIVCMLQTMLAKIDFDWLYNWLKSIVKSIKINCTINQNQFSTVEFFWNIPEYFEMGYFRIFQIWNIPEYSKFEIFWNILKYSGIFQKWNILEYSKNEIFRNIPNLKYSGIFQKWNIPKYSISKYSGIFQINSTVWSDQIQARKNFVCGSAQIFSNKIWQRKFETE